MFLAMAATQRFSQRGKIAFLCAVVFMGVGSPPSRGLREPQVIETTECGSVDT